MSNFNHESAIDNTDNADNTDRTLAYCGLACSECSRQDCPGCQRLGCEGADSCAILSCVRDRGLEGCFACDTFPCDQPMFRNPRIRAFNRYARDSGRAELLDRLRINRANGIVYHEPGSLKGDYDASPDEEDILRLIRTGRMNPYVRCPALSSEHYQLRLVQEGDSADLLSCYSDTAAQPFFNADNCTGGFSFHTPEQMDVSIRMWLESYARQDFIRFAIIDAASGRAVGTIEMFGKIGSYRLDWGLLRLDVVSALEKEPILQELFKLCLDHFFDLFDVPDIVTKAIPQAEERLRALQALGFRAHDLPGRTHYWSADRR